MLAGVYIRDVFTSRILMWDVIILVIKYADQWKHYDVEYVYHMKILPPSDLKLLNYCRT